MKVVTDLAAVPGRGQTVVALGNFDGVHVGHQAIIRAAVEWAHRLGATAVATTFDPMPMVVLRPEHAPRVLTPVREKSALMAALGVDVHLVLPFTREFANLTPEQFVDGVLMQLGPVGVCCGFNYSFGEGARGRAETLQALCGHHGVPVQVFDAVSNGDQLASSTAVRTALDAGDTEKAHRLLGRPYEVSGPVVYGDRRGHIIGFPTANIGYHEGRQMPAPGVYAVRARLCSADSVPVPLGPWLDAMANLGRQPTLGGETIRLEVHIFDFHGDLYGQTLTVQFWQRLRDVQRFAGIDALVAQLYQDAGAARTALAGIDREAQ